MLFAIFVLLIGVCHAFTEGGYDHQCQVQLVSTWNTTPFSLQVIETLSSFNQSLYEPLLDKFLGLTEDDEIERWTNASDEELYRALLSLIEQKHTKHLIDIHLANKFVTPRIESHFHYYRTEVLPIYEKKLLKKCGSIESAWVLVNDDIYCTLDDLFAIKSFNNEQKDLLTPFDRLIGDSASPIIVLYGRFEDTRLHELFKTLFEFATSGSYRFVWRYIPSLNTNQPETLGGYGVDLTLKRTDYIAIDDRNQKKVSEEGKVELSKRGRSNLFDTYLDDIEKVFDISSLDLQFTKFIADKGVEGYQYLKKVITDFPKYASFLSSYSTDFSSIEENSKLKFEPGLYINGRQVGESYMNVGHIVSILDQEFNFIDLFQSYSVNSSQAKLFIQSFALFRQSNVTRALELKRYNTFGEPGIVYLNDFERDRQYAHLSSDRNSYLKLDLKKGQIPSIRENVHDTVFVINLSDPIQLFHFIQFSTTVLNRDFPQQVGIVPLIENEIDMKIAATFLYLVHMNSIKVGFDFLQQMGRALVISKDGKPVYDMSIIDSLELPPQDVIGELLSVNQKFIKKFGVKRPHVILNGVFYEFSERWQYAIAKQIYSDFLLIQQALGATESTDRFLREYLTENAADRRNTLIVSDSPDFEGSSYHTLIYADQLELNENFISRSSGVCDSSPLTLTLLGQLNSKKFLKLLMSALEIQSDNECLKLRFLDTSFDSLSFEKLKKILKEDDYEKMKEALDELLEVIDNSAPYLVSKEKATILEDQFGINSLSENEILIILNGNIMILDDLELDRDDLNLIINNVKKSYLDFIFGYFKDHIPVDGSAFEWFETFSSLVLKNLFTSEGDGADIFADPQVSRLSTPNIDVINTVSFHDYNPVAKLDVVAIIQPTDEISQKIVALLQLLEGFDSCCLNINVLLKPSLKLETMKINRFYRGVYPNTLLFDESGMVDDNYLALFEDVPEKTLFTFDLDVPSAWVVGIKEGETDLDNVRLKDTGDVKGIYELENILVEGYLRGVAGADVGGIQVELIQGDIITDTNIMSNLGYLQLKANPGIWNFQVKSNSESFASFELLSADTVFSERLSEVGPGLIKPVSIIDLSGATIFPIFGPKKGSSSLASTVKNFFDLNFGDNKKTEENAEINIFSVASGHLYERFLGIMTESVMKHTTHSVKFWIIENYMSPTFRKNLPKLSEKYGFSYELITYKWPKWLRPQREKQRTIWGYKILFLDVLFPQNLDKVIFVDADQIVRVDMKELVDLDLEGAPYGYTPMCDSRAEMEGFRFWKQGYWDQVLGQKGLKYHISALYVIDLKKFREIKAGDILRQHYQALSADPKSLSNLDQDLPNNLQSQIKIFSLPQEWLWCETWCSDESLKDAKTIDLCNNPLTKEPKLDRARRQVAEWTEYDDEINQLLSDEPLLSQGYQHDEL